MFGLQVSLQVAVSTEEHGVGVEDGLDGVNRGLRQAPVEPYRKHHLPDSLGQRWRHGQRLADAGSTEVQLLQTPEQLIAPGDQRGAAVRWVGCLLRGDPLRQLGVTTQPAATS
jgi:hypothetical protein